MLNYFVFSYTHLDILFYLLLLLFFVTTESNVYYDQHSHDQLQPH